MPFLILIAPPPSSPLLLLPSVVALVDVGFSFTNYPGGAWHLTFDDPDATEQSIRLATTLFAKLYSEAIVPVARSYANSGHAPLLPTVQSSPVKSPDSNPSKNVSTNGTTRTSSMYAAPTWTGDEGGAAGRGRRGCGCTRMQSRAARGRAAPPAAQTGSRPSSRLRPKSAPLTYTERTRDPPAKSGSTA